METGDILELNEEPRSGTGVMLLTKYTDSLRQIWWKCIVVHNNIVTGIIKDILELELELEFNKINKRILNENTSGIKLTQKSVLRKIL